MFSLRCALAHHRWRNATINEAASWDRRFGFKRFFPLYAPLTRDNLPSRFKKVHISRQLAAHLARVRSDATSITESSLAIPLPRRSRLYSNLPSSCRYLLKALRDNQDVGYNTSDTRTWELFCTLAPFSWNIARYTYTIP